MNIYHCQSIRKTYCYPPSMLLGKDATISPVLPVEGRSIRGRRGRYVRRLWPDTVIHTGAVESFESVSSTELVLWFRSGISSLEVFGDKKSKADLEAVLATEE